MNTKEKLYAPFQNIPSRRGRGGVYSYIRWQDVANRMNDVFGPNWSSEVISQEVIENSVIVRVRVTIFDKDTESFFKQEGFGGAPNDANAEAGNPFKAAYSKALKDACKRWGVGLYLEEDVDGSGNMTPDPTPPGYSGKEVGVQPLHQAAQPVPPIPTVPTVPPVTNVPSFPVDEPVIAEQFREPATVAPLPSTATPSSGMPLPPGVDMNMSSGVTIRQEESVPTIPPTPPTQSIPIPPTTPPPAVNLSVGEKPLTGKVPIINTGGPDCISDVQKAALHSILSIKGVEYNTLVTEAFSANGITKDSIPGPDDLTYDDAVLIVKYGNDKFRRR